MAKSVSDVILEEVRAIRDKLDRIAEHGCSKSEQHSTSAKNQGEIFRRINNLEVSQAEGRVKLAIFVALSSAAASAFITLGISYITKRM